MNTVTPEDIDEVQDKLSWRDDDIVVLHTIKRTNSSILIGVRRSMIAKLNAEEVPRALAETQHARFSVVLPFLSSDGVLFTP